MSEGSRGGGSVRIPLLNSELPDDVGQNLVVTSAVVVFVRCGCVAERFWVIFGFGDLVFLSFFEL